MIRVLFFASVRERLGVDALELEPAEAELTVEGLRELLAARGEPWARALGPDLCLLAAINQEMVSPQTTVDDGDEVAFFPPVTGG